MSISRGMIQDKLKNAFADNRLVWPLLKKGQEARSRLSYRYFYKWPGAEQRSSIREINLEWASNCNLRCQFCALDHNKPKKHMSVLVLHRFLDQWLADSRFHNVEKFNLYNGGETLLHPKRLEMLRAIKRYRGIALKRGTPFPKISMLTNGMLLRPKLVDTILDEGLLDEIGFSLDGGTPEDFERLRVNAKWKPFYDNVRYLAERIEAGRLPVRLYGITIIPQPNALSTEWMHSEFQALSQRFDHHELRRLHDWGGQVEIGTTSKAHKQKSCDLLLHQMVVLPDGNVTVCCNDLNGQGIIGNVMESSLWEIYNSPERRDYLHKIDSGQKADIPLCKDCQSF